MTPITEERKLGFVLPTFPVGSETFVAGEVRRLAERGLAIELLALSQSRRADPVQRQELESLGLRALYLLDRFPWRLLQLAVPFTLRHPLLALRAARENRLLPVPERASRLARWLKILACAAWAEQRALAHLHSHWSLPTDVAMVAADLLALPFSFSAHAHDIYDDGPLYERQRPGWGLARRIRRATFVATCTRENRATLARLAQEQSGKVRLIYHGVDLDLFDGRRAEPGPIPLIVSVGRLVRYKGFDELVTACGELRARGARFECVIVGDGGERHRLQRQIDDLDLGDCVRLVGSLPQREVRDWLARADIFVLYSDRARGQYGLPNVLLEALAMRVATVSSPLPTLDELIVSGANGLVVADRQALVSGLECLLRDPDQRARMAEAGRRAVETEFDARRTIVGLANALLEPSEPSRAE